jgi:hyperosmotically inducible protein
MINRMRTGVLLSATLLAAQLGFAANHAGEAGEKRLEREVRRALVTLPFYSLFDHFAFSVEGYTVTLMGKVSRPTLKSDAENVVKTIEGVESVVNRIEVLPLSPNDDELRLRLYRAISGHSVHQTLAIRAVPPIHPSWRTAT